MGVVAPIFLRARVTIVLVMRAVFICSCVHIAPLRLTVLNGKTFAPLELLSLLYLPVVLLVLGQLRFGLLASFLLLKLLLLLLLLLSLEFVHFEDVARLLIEICQLFSNVVQDFVQSVRFLI